jgi:hypothetical protein
MSTTANALVPEQSRSAHLVAGADGTLYSLQPYGVQGSVLATVPPKHARSVLGDLLSLSCARGGFKRPYGIVSHRPQPVSRQPGDATTWSRPRGIVSQHPVPVSRQPGDATKWGHPCEVVSHRPQPVSR